MLPLSFVKLTFYPVVSKMTRATDAIETTEPFNPLSYTKIKTKTDEQFLEYINKVRRHGVSMDKKKTCFINF